MDLNTKEKEEVNAKMQKMEEVSNKNIFNNAVKETNEKLRLELLELKELFKKNIQNLSKNIGNIDIKKTKNEEGNNEEIEDLKVALEHKSYQAEILKKEFTKYEDKAEKEIVDLTTENAKLKYRIHILLKTIEELEKNSNNESEIKENEKKNEKKIYFGSSHRRKHTKKHKKK